MEGIDKVGGEMGLTVLAYNIKRVLNILGVDDLITVVKGKSNKIFNNLENIWIKIKDLFFYWLKTTYIEVIYA